MEGHNAVLTRGPAGQLPLGPPHANLCMLCRLQCFF